MNKKETTNPKELKNQNYEAKKMNTSSNLKKKKDKDLPWWVELLFVQIGLPDKLLIKLLKDSKLIVEKSNIEKSDSEKLPSDIVFEQSPDQLLDSLLPLYLQNQVLRALQESAASELACRMTAMNNASDNAKELASTLNLTYNKARQAAITQEILEVVGGSAV